MNRKLLYQKWSDMKIRCYSPKYTGFKNYGGRGIIVCSSWINNFDAFYNWAILNGFKKGLQIDRINNNKSYCPSNCRFVTKKENNRNRSITKLTYKQVLQIRCKYYTTNVTQEVLAFKYGVSRNTISQIVTYRRWN